jgi:hypothetical protein
MKTVLLFTGGLDSTYLAYRILQDTSDELYLYVLTPKTFSPYNPSWLAPPNHTQKILNVISELKRIRNFNVIYEKVNNEEMSFELDNPIAYAFYKIIPKINDGTYDRISTGHSHDHCSMKYFKYLDILGVGGDKIAKKMFEQNAKRGSFWFPFMTHDIHQKYGRYHAIKNLPENIRKLTVSCLPVRAIETGPCGKCGKCLINNVTNELIEKGYNAEDIQCWMEEKSLEYGGGDRHAPPPIWIQIYKEIPTMPVDYGLDNNTRRKTARLENKQSFIEWWHTIVYNMPIDKTILKWKKTSEDWKKLIL